MSEGRERSKTFLEEFNFKVLDSHYFEELESSFWDTENIMTKKYKSKRDKILKSEVEGDIESLEKAYKVLLNTKSRKLYCKFLMYQYTLSQPINMNLLIEKYFSIIFPFYLFPLKNEKEENRYLVLDNMNFSVNYYEKNSLKNSFEVDTIEDMKLNNAENNVKIKIIKSKNEIIIIPQIEEHLQLLYALIIFMGIIKKKKDNWKKDQSKVNEINQNLVKETINTIFDAKTNLSEIIKEFKLLALSNDSFVPKGIKYYTYIQDKSKNNSSITNKFLVLGSSYIYLFKDQEMKDILNIIPLSPGLTMFEFIEKDKNMKIFVGQKDYNFYFENIESFSKVQKIVISISEGEEDLFDDDDLIKVSESLYNDKIMGGQLKDTPLFCKSEKDLAILELKIENLKRTKKRAEKKGQIYYNLNIENENGNGNENIIIKNEDNSENNNNNINDNNIINNNDSEINNNNIINDNQVVNEENKVININIIDDNDDCNNNNINDNKNNDNRIDNNNEEFNDNKEDENNENKNDNNEDNIINNNNNILNKEEES